MTEHELVSTWYELVGADPRLVGVLDDTKRDLSLVSTQMETTFPGWKAEDKRALFESLVKDLTPAVGTKRWQRTLQGL